MLCSSNNSQCLWQYFQEKASSSNSQLQSCDRNKGRGRGEHKLFSIPANCSFFMTIENLINFYSSLSVFISKWCPPQKKNSFTQADNTSKAPGLVLQQEMVFAQWSQQFSRRLMPANSTFHLKIEYCWCCFQHLWQMVSGGETVPVSTSPSLNPHIQVTDGSGNAAPCSKGS